MARLISDKELAELWAISPGRVSQALPPFMRKLALLMRHDWRRTMLLAFEAMDELDRETKTTGPRLEPMEDQEFAARYDMLTGRAPLPHNGRPWSR